MFYAMNRDHQPEFIGGSPEQPPQPVGSVFRIGDKDVSMDVTFPGTETDKERRLFVWQIDSEDLSLAGIAGWQDMLLLDIDKDYAYLEIPTGTRSARSVLSGVEAWPGEKAAFIDFLGGYVNSVRDAKDGQIDVSVSLSTIARTKEGKFFITPPHDLSDEPLDVSDWMQKTKIEIETVLAADDDGAELTHRFVQHVAETKKG